MKQLQCNFTTPEQSRRLLELGVPADSADCYMLNRQIEHGWDYNDYDIYVDECNVKCATYKENNTIIPCWSVGRLIEIYCLCMGKKTIELYTVCSLIEEIMNKIECLSEVGVLDISKLEE